MVALSQDQNIFLTHLPAQNFDIHIIWWPNWVKWRPNRKQNSLILCRRLPYKEFDWNSDRLRFWVGRRKNLLIPIFGILLFLEVANISWSMPPSPSSWSSSLGHLLGDCLQLASENVHHHVERVEREPRSEKDHTHLVPKTVNLIFQNIRHKNMLQKISGTQKVKYTHGD